MLPCLREFAIVALCPTGWDACSSLQACLQHQPWHTGVWVHTLVLGGALSVHRAAVDVLEQGFPTASSMRCE
jgi:hypothetical protein